MSKRWKSLFAVLITLLLASVAYNITVGISSNDADAKLQNVNSKYESILGKYYDLQSTLDRLEKENCSLDYELDYLMDNAVFVTTSGECYHRECCQYMQGHRYYIYNVENAKAKGYRRCSVCFGDDYDWREHI